jgi:hypothetical protein
LPCYTLWKNTTAEPDGYVTGLEPGTNFPNPRSFETQRGRVVKLAPARRCVRSVARIPLRLGSVREAEEAISGLRGLDKPEIFEQPQSDWCVIG